MTDIDRIGIVDALMARYNAQDAAGYAAMMTDDAAEVVYRGAVLREGREGVRAGLAAMFAEFPDNRAVVNARYAVGDKVVLHETVHRGGSVPPFDVISIYSFVGGAVERVEFVR